MYQLIRLWNCRKTFSYLIASGFIVLHSVTIAYTVITVIDIKGGLFQIVVMKDLTCHGRECSFSSGRGETDDVACMCYFLKSE